jgi:hypothetical protein
MEIPAGFTLLGPARGDLLILADRQDNPVDAVSRPLVVDDCSRAELGYCQESRSREILLAIFRLTAARDER